MAASPTDPRPIATDGAGTGAEGTGGPGPGQSVTVAQIARMIDHSLLRPDLTPAAVDAGCALAAQYRVASVCVKPADVVQAVAELSALGALATSPRSGAPSTVAVGTVIGFPHGGTTTTVKVAESQEALDTGATELDMVLNIGRLRGGRHDDVLREIRAVVDVAHASGALVKVIVENAYLTDHEKVRACHLSVEGGADFVKTSTGFAPSGATLSDVILMRASVGSSIQIKAAGGVRTLDVLLCMVAEGVTRFGATATAQLLSEAAERARAGTLRLPPKAGS